MAVLSFTVPAEWDGERLDSFLRNCHHLSGTTIKRARHTEMGLTMNGEHIRTIDPIKAGAKIEVKVDNSNREYRPSDIVVEILYQDDDIVVLDKPCNMPCHPSMGHPYDSLANAFAAIEQMRGKVFRPIGRLDKDTSGAVVCALHAHSAYFLTENRPIKRYMAIVSPPPENLSGTIEANIARECDDSQKRCVSAEGQYALTHYKTLLKCEKFALLALCIETGRTHQIRVHMAHIGSPLIGDALYGGDLSELSRHALHCGKVEFIQPMKGECIQINSQLPFDMLDFLNRNFGKEQVENALLRFDDIF